MVSMQQRCLEFTLCLGTWTFRGLHSVLDDCRKHFLLTSASEIPEDIVML